MKEQEEIIGLFHQLEPLLASVLMEIETAQSYGLVKPTIVLAPLSFSKNVARSMGIVAGWLDSMFPSTNVLKVGMDLDPTQVDKVEHHWKFEFSSVESASSDVVNIACLRGQYITELFKHSNSARVVH